MQPAPGEREVLGRDGHAVAPAGLLAQAKEVREPVARDAEVVRDVRHDCQRVVDGEQPAEQVPDDLHALRRVDVARNEVRGFVQHRLEAFRRLGARRLLDAAVERLVVGRLSPLEVEGEVVRERDLEQRVAGALLVAEARQEVAGAAVVLEGLAVGVQRPGRVARLQQIVDGPRRLVCLAEVPREQREDLVARARIELLQGLPDSEVELSPLRLDQARIGDLLHEAVAEAILGRGTPPLLDDEVEALELRERRQQLLAG